MYKLVNYIRHNNHRYKFFSTIRTYSFFKFKIKLFVFTSINTCQFDICHPDYHLLYSAFEKIVMYISNSATIQFNIDTMLLVFYNICKLKI